MQHPGSKAQRRDASHAAGITLKIPENLRAALKKPIGILIKESDVSRAKILHFLPAGAYIVTVGDATTDKLVKFGLTPSLQIVDGAEKRQKRKPPQSTAKKLYCDNPAGQITNESIETIRKALGLPPPHQIIVNGEEDLLVIPVCMYAPPNTVVFYGQPNEGLVVVPVTDEIRNKTKAILNLMK
ncbi:MAG: GTP-dependent dephospho-CoA kinase family protein [Candidatus Nitrosotenuis sp.]